MEPSSSLGNRDDEEKYARGAPPLVPSTNIGDIMNYMMVLPSKELFDDFFEKVVTWSLANWVIKKPCTRKNAIALLKKNLRYWSGYAGRWSVRIEEYLK